TGSVKMGNPTAPCGPDGGNFGYRIVGFNGIGGIDAHVTGFLAGVFLTDAEPTDPPPPALSFAQIGVNFTTFAPQIGQVFFIGDGLNEAGATQQFLVPSGATRLFLGLADARYYDSGPGYYHDNSGAFNVTIVPLPLTEAPKTTVTKSTTSTTAPAQASRASTYSYAPPTANLPVDPSFGSPLPAGTKLATDIEASSDMIHWTTLTNISLYFRDGDSTNYSSRFYRFPGITP
ncbi:MAG TPA: hypothetical protein VF607_07505, partial [Verrucomicrobiae bacterium]